MGRRTGDSEDFERNPRFPEALGRTVKVIRTDLGMSRRELADRAGISYSYVTEIENGNKPPSSTVLGELAAALGLRMHELLEAVESRIDSMETEQALSFLDEADALSSAELPPRLQAQLRSHLRTEASAAAEAELRQQAESLSQAQARLQRERSAKMSPQMRSPSAYAMRPSLRGRHREVRAALMELERLLRDMDPEDVERLLDYARRLMR